MFFKTLKSKLLTLMITLSLIPLAGISAFSYFIGSRQIAEDRLSLSLVKMAQDVADKVDLMLKEKKEEVHSMATTFPLIYPSLDTRYRGEMIRLLNNYCFNHDVYDVLLVVDRHGRIVGINTVDRYEAALPPDKVSQILSRNIRDFPEELGLFEQAITGHSAQHDWYQSRVVQGLYDYGKEDTSYQYNIAHAEPITNPRTKEVMGVWINILNWAYIQNILDNVELDLERLNLRTGYAFMFKKDANTIIAHKYRANRPDGDANGESYSNLYNTRLIETHGLKNLHDAIVQKLPSYAYEFPRGNSKISGLAPVENSTFGWIIGVGIDGADIFRPIQDMKWWLLGMTLGLATAIVLFTYWIARGVTVPISNLILTARTIAQGNLGQRVQVQSSDEVGILGSTFNDMARALSARESELHELNKNLENIVRQRTLELQNSHEALKKAYTDLQNAQEQLVQTEKMASLGQLVAGIAHEIKNPLNFIYGNTSFLAEYAQKLQALIEAYESLPSLSPEDEQRMKQLKEKANYTFIREDLGTLIDNFTEGARRINAIVSDLRTFSRMDTDTVSEIDIHASLEMSLNLLRNQYKNRIEIHREFGDIPRIQGFSGKIGQVFMNILSNAFHAIPDKGDVWLRTRSENGVVEIEVEDNGVGIAREHLSRIFEPFFTTKAIGKGTGLGLSISYGIIEQHNGKIHVSSTPNKGSSFTVRLPVFMDKA